MQNRHTATDRFVVSRDKEAATHLSPGLFPAGRQSEWSAQNRTLIFSIHPLSNKTALAVGGKKTRESLSNDTLTFDQDQRVHICGISTESDSRLAFINDTHAVFVALQQLMEEAGADDSTASAVGIKGLVKMSVLYREAMQRQSRVLADIADPNEFIKEEAETFRAIHAVWHLLEIIYLTTNTPGLSTSIVPHFMEWLNANFLAPLAEDAHRIAGGSPTADDLARNELLWPYLKKLALRGHVSVLGNMLERLAPSQLLSASAARWARSLSQLCRKMPLSSSDETAGSFNSRWRQWNEELRGHATAIGCLLGDAGEKDGGAGGDKDKALEALFAISEVMRGDLDAIAAEGEMWQDIMGATLLYSEPTARADRLPALVGAIIEQFEESAFTELDRALVALLNHDLAEFLVHCDHIDHWLSAHISDLMDHISVLDICRRVFVVDPREHYLMALGESYLGHEDLWRVGLDYLGLCRTVAGALVMEEYVTRIPLDSDRKAEQVLRVCEVYTLECARDRIHRQLGRQKWQRGRLGAAIAHFAQVCDHDSIGLICDQIWNAYISSGELTYGPTIDGVMASSSLSEGSGSLLHHEGLQFLSKYRDFHELYAAGAFVEAGKVLLSILLCEIAPAYALGDLLVDSIPLLEGDTLVFSSEDTFELMRVAESLAQSQMRQSQQDGAIDCSEMNIFNVACTRNLARSFVMF
ncbi:nucleoporin Nup85-like protein [Kickxella alabastrina]|uniref:nucleoporin Nup85-like protein n=1 Tax=Kickxella alabastrina TaxID=61397 RepID=UPI00221F9B90|nr:nucleoporin Nup85-like protein [Kickxella alabastrina]KAI7823697.1 nucleoporin Nup85-like protein [Kickxella alabastrina]